MRTGTGASGAAAVAAPLAAETQPASVRHPFLPRRRRDRLGIPGALLTALCLATFVLVAPPATEAGARPNFLIILSADQRHDTMDYMPRTKARIFGEGVAFQRAYITTSLCCPSRASVVTGMYAHKHGVRLNPIPLQKETFIERLKRSGYCTGQVGKYLPGWPDQTARILFRKMLRFLSAAAAAEKESHR